MEGYAQQRINEAIEQRLRELEKIVSNIPVRFAAPSGELYPSRVIKIYDKFLRAGKNGGFYLGQIGEGLADSAYNDAANTSNNLTMPEGMFFNESKTCTVMNLAENGQQTHTLAIGSYAIGIKVATYIKDNHGGKMLPSGERLFDGEVTDVYAISPGGSALPPGTGKYKVLMLVDNNSPGTPGWDFVRAHG